MDKKLGFRRAGSIVVPDQFFNPVKTGVPELDRALSEIGGFIPSQVIFITGPPGAGKTTLMLAAASRLVEPERTIAFISLEMSEFQIAHQARKIPNFEAVHVTDDFDQVKTLEEIRKLKPGLIILDSIQKAARKMLRADGTEMPFNTGQVEVVNMFLEYAKETWTPVCLIGHCDKSGNYKGPSDILHDVDSHLMVKYDREMDLRTFEFGKNRFGGEMGETLFGFNSSGVWIGSPYYEPDSRKVEISGEEITVEHSNSIQVTSSERVQMAFRALEETWNAGTVRAACTSLINYLKEVDEEAEETIIGNFQKVKLQFSGKGAGYCDPQKGLVVFGKGCVFNFNFGTMGYKKEKPYIERNCSSVPQLLAWTIVHEWCHLYKGMQHHKHEFFQFLERKYTQHVAGLF